MPAGGTLFGVAGVAIALQRVITAFAAYLIMLRWRVFTLGDRISMAVVRTDVIALGFIHAMIMEMGQPPVEVAALASRHQAEHVRRASRRATYPPTFLSKTPIT